MDNNRFWNILYRRRLNYAFGTQKGAVTAGADGRWLVKSVEARDFASWLYHITNCPVRFVDERYTTALANRLLREAELTHKKRKKQVDKVAALLILETYLESAKHPSFQPLPLED